MRPPLSRGGLIAACAAGFIIAAAAAVMVPAAIARKDAPPPMAVSIGGPFRLSASQGGMLSDADLKGRPFTVFFGFTRCPDVCPTTLWEMSESLRRLGPEAADLTALFVSVDPERDTPESLADYLQSFDRRIIGLTGAPADVAALAKAYRVYWRKVPMADGDYTMDHTAAVYLMDRAGRFVDVIAYKDDAETRDRKLRALLAIPPGSAGS